MKTTNNFILILAAVASMACSKETEVEEIIAGRHTFSAMLENPTKTTLVPGESGKLTKMEWKAGDRIGMFDASNVPQPFTTEQGGAEAVFSGEASTPASKWFAFYPYREDVSLAGSSGSENLRIIIPEVQYAVKGNIPANVATLVASCEVGEKVLNFKHQCGLVSINVPAGCLSVTLETDGTALSGGIAAPFNASSPWSTRFKYSSVTLVSPDGGAMEEGTYYMAVLPVNHTGKVLLTMRRQDGKISVKEATALQVGKAQVRPINVTPVWMEDDGFRLYTEESGNKCTVSAANSTVEDVTDVKLLGEKSTKWVIEAGQQGYFKLVGVNSARVPVSGYGEGYALEYYVKAVTANVNASSWEMYHHDYAGKWVDSSNQGKYSDKYIVYSKHMGKDTYCGINDNEWHRISDPLDATWIKKINSEFLSLELRLHDKSLNGNVFYIDDIRVVRKTATVSE